MDLRPPDAAAPKSRRRRSPLSTLTWLVVALLICFLVAVASGLITDNAAAPTALFTKTPPAVARELAAGWGPHSSYIGRYRGRILASSGAKAYRPTAGQLTLFMRVVKTTSPPLPSGILALQTPSGENLVYLTSLIKTAGTFVATVNGGAFVGPVIGSFSAIRGPGAVDAVVSLQGVGSFEVDFTRFSDSPQP
jgi:hypothetical protein